MDAFRTWMAAQGIVLSSVAKVADSGAGRGIFAAKDVSEGTTVLTVPKKACLTVKSCSISDIISKEGLDQGLGLILSIMHEVALGDDSKWAPFFQAIPASEQVPMLWSDADVEYLQGTDVEELVLSEVANMREDYDGLLEPVLKRHATIGGGDQAKLDFEAFQRAASLMSSRAVKIDNATGPGLVPVLDFLNHRTDGEHVYLYRTDSKGKIEDVSVDSEDETEGQGARSAGEAGTHGGAKDCLYIKALKDASAGEELYWCYGEYGNSRLLHKYGFAELGNAHTAVKLDATVVSEVVGESEFSSAAAALGAQYMAEANFQVASDGSVSHDLLMLLRYVSSSKKERRGWAEAGAGEGCAAALGKKSAKALMSCTGVAGGVLAILQERLGQYPEGEPSEDRKKLKKVVKKQQGGAGAEGRPATGGYVARAGALALRITEMEALQRGFLLAAAALKAAAAKAAKAESGDADAGTHKAKKQKTKQ